MGEIDEVYKPGEAKDQAAKAALARKLLEDGRKNEANRAEQFVLLRRAGEIARDAGEADLMLEAVDAIVAAGFDIRPFQVKARLLKRLVEQAASGGDSQLSAVSASCVKFAEEAAANGAIDEASDVLDAAKKSLAKSILRAQTAQRAAKAALARARHPGRQSRTGKEGRGGADGTGRGQIRTVGADRMRQGPPAGPARARGACRRPRKNSRPIPTTRRPAWRSVVGIASTRAIGTRA